MNFIAIDFETANANRTSACALGITSVENGKIVGSRSFLIKPYPFWFDAMNTMIHGISESEVINSPTFDELWSQISKEFEGKLIVAHNASFDISVLRRTLEHYDLPLPTSDILCTYRLSQKLFPDLGCYRLDYVSDYFGIDLCHHLAKSDANACAEILLKSLEKFQINDIAELIDTYELSLGHIDDQTYCPFRTSKLYYNYHCYPKAKDFQNIDSDYIDDDFVNKKFVFTGTLSTMQRAKAMEIVAAGGGVPQDNVTKSTNYLVAGIQDMNVIKNGMSSKMRKAIEYKKCGQEIEIIGEDQFLSMIDEELFKRCDFDITENA